MTAVGRALGAPIGILRTRSSRRRLLLVLAVLGLLLGTGYMWLRDSPLVAVEKVKVTGASGGNSTRVRAALRSAALGMTTLDYDVSDLRAAVRAYPEVSGVRVKSQFPHRMQIIVSQHHPVAVVASEGHRIPVAEDGTLMRDTSAAGLPSLPASPPQAGDHLTGAAASKAVVVLAAAPRSVLGRISSVASRAGSVDMRLGQGPTLVFGTPDAAAAKWAALLRVLADPTIAGATYVDVSVPDRPAIGGLAANSTSTGDGSTASDPNGAGGAPSNPPSNGP